MANKNEVGGVKAKKSKPVVVPVPDDPANQYRSKEEFIKIRQAQKAANKAAEEARLKVLKEHGVGQPEAVVQGPTASDEKIATLRKSLAAAEKSLASKPDSKAWKKKVAELSDQLEIAEAEQG